MLSPVRVRYWLLVALPLFLLVGLLFAQDEGPKSYALIVGVGDYRHASFGKLDCTENDAEKLAETLDVADSRFKGRVRVLTCTRGKKNKADAPTAENIRKAVAQLIKGKKRGDTILVALSGHGMELVVSDPRGKEKDKRLAMFCPQDVELTGTNYVTGHNDNLINLETLLADLADSGADNRVVLVDACRDEVKARRVTRSMSISSRIVPANTAMLMACKSEERSFESKSKLGHGVFFYYVIQGLKGAKEARNEDGEVTWATLSTYVQRQVKKNVEGIVGGGARQEPREYRGDFGDVVLLKPGKEKIEITKGPKPGEERSAEIAPGVKMVMCWIPEGEAQLGSPKAERDAVLKLIKKEKEPEWLQLEAEEKRGKYKTKGFWLAKYECTQEQYEAVMGKNPSYFDGKKNNEAKGEDTKQFPVETVSWDDCKEFVKKVNGLVGAGKPLGKGIFCLPHEDEWEYAYRGGKGNKRAYYWGDALNGKEANCDGNYPYGTETKGTYLERTTKVGSYEKKASHPWGLVDMSGNVWEWCDNLYTSDQKYRVLRGGSWFNGARICRAAYRSRNEPDGRDNYFGFRLCFRLDG